MNFDVLPGKQPGSFRVWSGELTLEAVYRLGRRSEADITAYRSGDIAHRDSIDLARHEARAAFADGIKAKLDGVCDIATVERMLLALGEHQRGSQGRSGSGQTRR